MKITWLLLLFVCLYQQSVCPVIVSGSRWDLNGKTIVLLGDLHMRTLHDKMQKELIEKAVGDKVFSPVQVFIENLPFSRQSLLDSHIAALSQRVKEYINNSSNVIINNNTDYIKGPEEREYDILDIPLNNLDKSKNEGREALKGLQDSNDETLRVAFENFLKNGTKSSFLETFNQNTLAPYTMLDSLLARFREGRKVLDRRYQILDPRVDLVGIALALRTNDNAIPNSIYTFGDSLEKEFDRVSKKFDDQKNIKNFYEKNIKDIKNFKKSLRERKDNFDYWNNSLKFFFKITNPYFAHKILETIFFTNKKVVIGIFGAQHINWIEKRLLRFNAIKKVSYSNKADLERDNLLKKTILTLSEGDNEQALLKFVKDAKERMKKDEGHYYFKNEELLNQPLNESQIKDLLNLPCGIFDRFKNFFTRDTSQTVSTFHSVKSKDLLEAVKELGK